MEEKMLQNEFIEDLFQALEPSFLPDLYYHSHADTLDKKLSILSTVLEYEEMPWLRDNKEKQDYLEIMETQYVNNCYEEMENINLF